MEYYITCPYIYTEIKPVIRNGRCFKSTIHSNQKDLSGYYFDTPTSHTSICVLKCFILYWWTSKDYKAQERRLRSVMLEHPALPGDALSILDICHLLNTVCSFERSYFILKHFAGLVSNVDSSLGDPIDSFHVTIFKYLSLNWKSM